MNQRILDLANEANKDIGYTFKMEEAKQLHELMEKFAELLVKECADKAYKTAWDDLTLGYGIGVIPLHLHNTIKEHFGVEE